MTTPNKRTKLAHSLHLAAIDPYDPLISAHSSPVTHRSAIGPTPQKDGMVLGLFDGLSGDSQSITPSRRWTPAAILGAVRATPIKRPGPLVGETQIALTGGCHRKNPTSALQNTEYELFLTPSARRIVNSNDTPGSRASVSKLRFDGTPYFLRRHSQHSLTVRERTDDDTNISWSPAPIRMLPKPYAGKELSTLVKGLRKLEEERLDEDLEVLREIENVALPQNAIRREGILVKDSQRLDMALGPDGGIKSDDQGEYSNEGKERDGGPLRVWKKKGQKRTTKKVVMKPNAAKWVPEPAWKEESQSEDEIQAAIADSKVVNERPNAVNQSSENEGQIGENKPEEAMIKGRRFEGDRARKEEKLAMKVKKKISATAHANFRALKIKNKQSRAKRRGSIRGRR